MLNNWTSSELITIGLYLLMTINSSYITYLFYKSTNGMLRKFLIWFFASMTWAFIVRDLMLLHLINLNLYWAVIPLTITSTLLAGYLKKTYR